MKEIPSSILRFFELFEGSGIVYIFFFRYFEVTPWNLLIHAFSLECVVFVNWKFEIGQVKVSGLQQRILVRSQV